MQKSSIPAFSMNRFHLDCNLCLCLRSTTLLFKLIIHLNAEFSTTQLTEIISSSVVRVSCFLHVLNITYCLAFEDHKPLTAIVSVFVLFSTPAFICSKFIVLSTGKSCRGNKPSNSRICLWVLTVSLSVCVSLRWTVLVSLSIWLCISVSQWCPSFWCLHRCNVTREHSACVLRHGDWGWGTHRVVVQIPYNSTEFKFV